MAIFDQSGQTVDGQQINVGGLELTDEEKRIILEKRERDSRIGRARLIADQRLKTAQ